MGMAAILVMIILQTISSQGDIKFGSDWPRNIREKDV